MRIDDHKMILNCVRKLIKKRGNNGLGKAQTFLKTDAKHVQNISVLNKMVRYKTKMKSKFWALKLFDFDRRKVQ